MEGTRISDLERQCATLLTDAMVCGRRGKPATLSSRTDGADLGVAWRARRPSRVALQARLFKADLLADLGDNPSRAAQESLAELSTR